MLESVPNDAGQYTVRAKNPFGEVSCSANLEVQGKSTGFVTAWCDGSGRQRWGSVRAVRGLAADHLLWFELRQKVWRCRVRVWYGLLVDFYFMNFIVNIIFGY